MSKRYEDLTFTDDFMFCRIMQYNEEICKEVTELLIGRKIGGIVKKDRQHSVDITPDGKGVRMDVYLEDDMNTIYNIEMQNSNYDNLPRRARYYQSMIDVDLANRGMNYDELNNSYVVFINMFDLFGRGLPKYTFRNMCDEARGVSLDDGATKIFINATGFYDKMDAEMRAFLKYLMDCEATSDLTKKIENQVYQVKHDSMWRGDYMTLEEHYKIERAEGRAEGRVESVDNLVETMGLSVEEACKALKFSVQEYEKAKSSK